MKPIAKQSNKKAAFTIVELLTVMSIIVILIGLLVPALNKVKRFARDVKQRAQFHSINVALDLFNAEWDGYPPSIEKDEMGVPYCGAMKLCEAMVGQDLKGFHPNSRFRNDGTDGGTPPIPLYPGKDQPTPIEYAANLKARKGLYLQLENANAYRLDALYPPEVLSGSPFEGERFVLCDVYARVTNLGIGGRSKIGMPVLYYKANTSNTDHNIANPGGSIYDYRDDLALIDLGIPWNPSIVHPMASSGLTSTGATADPRIFYEKTRNDKIATMDRPYRADSYILLSAGYDGEYGTADDIFNFEQ